MRGTVVKATAEEGSTVVEGDPIIVIEAMKMERPVKAHKTGAVTGLSTEVGATVTCRIKD